MIINEIKPNGFCGGVKKAIQMINAALQDPKTIKPIYMLGYLVHNKKIVNSYQNYKGITIVTSDYNAFLDTISYGTVIFTAHGISPKIIKKAVDKGLNIIDTTCINVKKIQNLINEKILTQDVYVIGNDNHPEVLGYLGISNKVKLYHEDIKLNDNSFVINQTTLIYDDVLKTFQKLKKINNTITISEEICTATKTRQNALIENINNYDMFLIIGDRLSNNCKSLYDIIVKKNKLAFKIEDITELNNIDFKNINSIGITAGASTPPTVVNEIIKELQNYYEGKVFSSKLTDEDYLKF